MVHNLLKSLGLVTVVVLAQYMVPPMSRDVRVVVGSHYNTLRASTVYMIHPITKKEEKSETVYLDAKKPQHFAVGSGIVVGENSTEFFIVTNLHVCTTDKDECFVSLDGNLGGDRIKLTYVRTASTGVDLELWKVAKILLPEAKPIVGFARAQVGEKVYNVGNYLGLPFIYAEGIVAGYENEDVLLDIPSGPGCSGSGVYNNKNELIAVIYSGNIIPPFTMDTSKAVALDGILVQDLIKGAIHD